MPSFILKVFILEKNIYSNDNIWMQQSKNNWSEQKLMKQKWIVLLLHHRTYWNWTEMEKAIEGKVPVHFNICST